MVKSSMELFVLETERSRRLRPLTLDLENPKAAA